MSRRARSLRKAVRAPIRSTHATSDGRPIRVGSIVWHPALGYFRVVALHKGGWGVDVQFAPQRVTPSTYCRLATKEERLALAVCGPVLLS